MDLSYLTFLPSEYVIKLKRSNKVRNYNVSSCCDYLIDYQNSNKDTFSIPDTLVEHWWERNWQVSLDYYLSSPPANSKRQQTETNLPSNTQRSFDFALLEKIEDGLYSPIQALLCRKTYRKFQEKAMSSHLLSTLLRELKDEIFKNIWKYYVVIFNVEGMPPGIYLYCCKKQGLYLIKQGLYRNEVVELLCGMAASYTASFLLILAIDLEKAMQKASYNRALREIYIDSGRLAQKIVLKGMQHCVGGVPSSAMKDSLMCSFLNIDPKKCIPIYTITMGIVHENSKK